MIGVEAERDVTWSVGPAILTPLPLFDWGQARRRKAIATQVENRHKLTAARRRIVEDVRRAFDTYVATLALLAEARTRLLPLQESRQRLAEASYQAGESDLTTLLLAEEELQDSRAKLVDYEQKATVAFIRLRRAVGGPGAAAALVPSTAPSMLPSTTAPADRPAGGDAPGGGAGADGRRHLDTPPDRATPIDPATPTDRSTHIDRATSPASKAIGDLP